MGTISCRKANTFLFGAVELKFQLLSQYPEMFLREFFCSSNCAQLVFALYLLRLKDFVISKSSFIYIVRNYQQKK